MILKLTLNCKSIIKLYHHVQRPCLKKIIGSPQVFLLLNYVNPSHHLFRQCHHSLMEQTVPTVSYVQWFNEHFGAENEFAFKILLKNQEFASKISEILEPVIPKHESNFADISSFTWSDKPYELVNQFESISAKAKVSGLFLSNDVFKPMVEALVGSISQMNDEELSRVLKSLAHWPMESDSQNNFDVLWKAIDNEYFVRCSTWKREKILLMLSHWYILGLIRKSRFVFIGLKKIGRKPDRLSAQELVQFMFYLNLTRCHHPSVHMLDIEWALYKHVNTLTMEELGIIGLGFFKSQTLIREPKLLSSLVRRLGDNLDSINSFSLVALLKVIRYSARHYSMDSVSDLLEKLSKQAESYSLLQCMHIALLSEKCNIRNEKFNSILCSKLRSEISTARIKELETAVACLTNFSFECNESPNIYDLVIDEFRNPRRSEELTSHPKVLPSLLSRLCMVEKYPEDCISKVFSEEYLKLAFGKRLNKFSLPAYLLKLYFGIKLEVPTYTGPLLDPELIDRMCDQHGWYIPRAYNKAKVEKLAYDCFSIAAKLLGGEEYVKIIYCLPSFSKPDIIYCLDEKTNQPIPIPETLKDATFMQTTLPSKSGKWHCIFGIGEYPIYGTKEMLGFSKMKSRLLQKIGYKPIYFSASLTDWLKHSSDQEREKYLENVMKLK